MVKNIEVKKKETHIKTPTQILPYSPDELINLIIKRGETFENNSDSWSSKSLATLTHVYSCVQEDRVQSLEKIILNQYIPALRSGLGKMSSC
jgi:hypothetical protein